jgi:hypothetical protein
MDIREKLVELLWEYDQMRMMRMSIEECVDRLVPKGVTVQEWISVKDRLPDESGEYLAYCGECDGICVLYFEILKTKSKWRTNWKEVTHWMPLPQPPKGE